MKQNWLKTALAAVALAFVASTSALAAIPAALSGMVTGLGTDGASLLTTYAIPAIAGIVTLFVLIKIARKSASKVGLALLGGGLALQSGAYAAVPEELSDMVTGLGTDGAALISTYAIPAIAGIVTLFVLIKIARKSASKVG